MAPTFKKRRLQENIGVHKTLETYELWETENFQFEDLLCKIKECAGAPKLDTDVARGKAQNRQWHPKAVDIHEVCVSFAVITRRAVISGSVRASRSTSSTDGTCSPRAETSSF